MISLINQEKAGSKKEGIAEDESENRSGIFGEKIDMGAFSLMSL